MAYSIDQEEQMMAMFDKIAAEPFVESANYNEVRNPRPIVESTRSFEGRKVNLEAWGTESSPKNNKTAKTGSAKKVTKNDTVSATKTKGQITKIVSDNASHEAKNEPAVKGGSFDTAAKNAAASNRSKAESNKKFVDACRYQKKCKMFKDFVSSLGVDAESTAAANKIIRKFDELNKKAALEAADTMSDEDVKAADRECFAGNEDACQAVDRAHKAEVRRKFFGDKAPAKSAGKSAKSKDSQLASKSDAGKQQASDEKVASADKQE